MTSPLVQIESRRSALISRSIDNTALDAYMSCPTKYLYSMEFGRRHGGALAPSLAFGTTWHAILDAHYKTGGDPDAVRKAAIMSWQPHNNPDDHRTLERALSSYDQYISTWGHHDKEAEGWGSTVGYPTAPVVEMATDIWWPGAPHPYAGKIDRVIEYQGLYYIEDHKTTSSLGPRFFHQFDPSNQMMGYAALAELLTGLPIAGVRINAFGVLKTQSKFERKTIPYSKVRIDAWKRNYAFWIERLEGSYQILENRLHNPAGPQSLQDGLGMLSHEEWDEVCESAFPRNFNACAGKYGQCQYSEVCTQAPQLRRRTLEFEYDVLPWDPMHSADEGGAE